MEQVQNNLQQLKLRKSAEQWEKGVFIYMYTLKCSEIIYLVIPHTLYNSTAQTVNFILICFGYSAILSN